MSAGRARLSSLGEKGGVEGGEQLPLCIKLRFGEVAW